MGYDYVGQHTTAVVSGPRLISPVIPIAPTNVLVSVVAPIHPVGHSVFNQYT